MVGNPCSRTLFDPLKMTNLPDIWVRGAIAQGSDLRPHLELKSKLRKRYFAVGGIGLYFLN